jgi:hypothetical protein
MAAMGKSKPKLYDLLLQELKKALFLSQRRPKQQANDQSQAFYFRDSGSKLRNNKS